MTIRHRLLLALLGMLIVLIGNLSVYLWSIGRWRAAIEDLRSAVVSQILTQSIEERLNEVYRQVSLLSQVKSEAVTAPEPSDAARFHGRLEEIGAGIGELVRQSRPPFRAAVTEMDATYKELSSSWRVFYANFGRNHARAIEELTQRAEPLSQRLMQQQLPALKEKETLRVKDASERYGTATGFARQLPMLLFAVSALLIIVVARRFWRDLSESLGSLKLGVAMLGASRFDYRIPIERRDELGDLARAYNDMAENLEVARKQAEQATIERENQNRLLEQQKQFAETLLLNILPFQVADELRQKDSVAPKYFEDVTILFTDFVGFTLSSEKLAAEDLVGLLHDYFTAFDEIVTRYYLEKLKTIGDSYMCVAGMQVGRRKRRVPSHPVDAVLAALEMIHAVEERGRPDSKVRWAVRVGLHAGPVIAGVVGINKFAFDVWGDSVNFASRMESAGTPNRINLSAQIYARVKDFFECEYRGRVMTKDKKEAEMYFVKGLLPELLDDPTQCPPPAFVRRYRIYFQKEPGAFPSFLLKPSGTG